jgi:hypothetical protein
MKDLPHSLFFPLNVFAVPAKLLLVKKVPNVLTCAVVLLKSTLATMIERVEYCILAFV